MKKKVSPTSTVQVIPLDAQEKAVLQRIVGKFREWYAALTVNELSKNNALVREINAFEGMFRAVLL